MRAWLFYPLALVVAVFAFGAILSVYPALPATDPKPGAPTQLACYSIEALAAFAAQRGEAVVFTGAAPGGLSLVLFANDDGGWTAADLDTDGVACVIATGTRGRMPDGPVFIPLIPEKPA